MSERNEIREALAELVRLKAAPGEQCRDYIWRDAWNAARRALAGTPAAVAPQPVALIQALRFYANKHHFMNDESAWDTVSGEPPNYWCDEAGTATVEDGSIAAAALRGEAGDWGEDGPPEPIKGERAPAVALMDCPVCRGNGCAECDNGVVRAGTPDGGLLDVSREFRAMQAAGCEGWSHEDGWTLMATADAEALKRDALAYRAAVAPRAYLVERRDGTAVLMFPDYHHELGAARDDGLYIEPLYAAPPAVALEPVAPVDCGCSDYELCVDKPNCKRPAKAQCIAGTGALCPALPCPNERACRGK